MDSLAYQVVGKGKNTLVFLHGFLEHSAMWLDYANQLKHQYQMVLIDLPGHGQSPCSKAIQTMESMAAQVNEVLTKINAKQVHLVGHSMGGYVALAFAEQFSNQVASVTLFFSTPLADSEEKKKIRLKAIKTAKADFKTFVKITIPKLFNPNQTKYLAQEIELAKTWAMQTSINGVEACLLGMRDRTCKLHLLQQANFPFLLILGSFDSAINTQALKDKIPINQFIKIIELPVGHMGHLEAKKQCLAALESFLENIK